MISAWPARTSLISDSGGGLEQAVTRVAMTTLRTRIRAIFIVSAALDSGETPKYSMFWAPERAMAMSIKPSSLRSPTAKPYATPASSPKGTGKNVSGPSLK